MKGQQLDLSLYLVTDRRSAGNRPILDIVRAALRGGVTAVQLRDKEATTRETLELGRALRELTRETGVSFIVNDRVDLVLALDADGVHVGQDDMPAEIARKLIGPERVLGVSAASVAEARQAERDGADYLGVGDVFGTLSKPDAGRPIGLEGLAKVARSAAVPVVGIGGITLENAVSVLGAGAAGVAVIAAVVATPDPKGAARRLRERVDQSQRKP
ncbi:MAG: thiamine phosphate synthase [Deinococcota bacterium]|nr:thiamine phosphate synthase [Deinococcota bacterium]